MSIFKDWLENQGKLIVTQPLSHAVPALSDYAQTEGLAHLGKRLLARKLYLFLTGQGKLRRTVTDKQWTHGLWIYERTAQIGDSLMDLAARSLFSEFGCEVDLLCKQNLGPLYQKDPWFRHIFTAPEQALGDKYDFVIIQSIHHRSLKHKIRFFKSLPWVCIQEFYDVPDFSRAQWGAQRISDLWTKQQIQLEWHGKQKIHYDACKQQSRKEGLRIVLALGGVDSVRTYQSWSQVVSGLSDDMRHHITLTGTGEIAQLQAQKIMQNNSYLDIENKVNQTSLDDIKTIFACCDMLVCADGGLMHLGVACDVKIILGLFIERIPPAYRLPRDYHDMALVSPTGSVNDIEASHVVNKLRQLMSASPSRPRFVS
ncbi:glycosyltransferase family 9 protein [Rhodoferax sp.]|uniref:glycosyltransferase family 9 protein n=1 Tax=Rhodoferax sp. TaxID=50421 RepID=UPI00283DB86B|nr:glycosyltransferase family 9 protein [Rhodoferax sp.]MDR3370197.1 glycosyltransferase family 9 protein [Rhodoferax sp.]